MAWVLSTVVIALIVWLLIYGARHTDEPWWKVWLLGRGLFPSAKDLRDRKDD